MGTLILAAWMVFILALLVLVLNDALEAEDRIGFLRRTRKRIMPKWRVRVVKVA